MLRGTFLTDEPSAEPAIKTGAAPEETAMRTIIDGYFWVLESPGLGIDVNEAALREYEA